MSITHTNTITVTNTIITVTITITISLVPTRHRRRGGNRLFVLRFPAAKNSKRRFPLGIGGTPMLLLLS